MIDLDEAMEDLLAGVGEVAVHFGVPTEKVAFQPQLRTEEDGMLMQVLAPRDTILPPRQGGGAA